MSDSSAAQGIGRRFAIGLAFLLVVVGMLNTMPEISGLQDWARDLTGVSSFEFRTFRQSFSTHPFSF